MPSKSEHLLEQAYEKYVESLKQEEKRERDKLAERGEVLLELIHQDDETNSREDFDKTYKSINETLNSHGVLFKQKFLALDSIDAIGGALPEYVIALKTVSIPASAAFAHILATWIKAKYARKVRLKIGELELEAEKVEDIEKMIELAKDYKSKKK
ncbi:hypothetical protein [Brevundimonas sp.]|uniref:hypothetical protein n=1 Tax=Brevundimonas sp. TaxID=1871086 RepID=UPI002FCC59E8